MSAPENAVVDDRNVVHEDRGPYVAVTAGHAAIDVFNSMGPVLLAFLRTPMALSNAEVGLAVGTYQFLAGATQPGFGWLADRIGSRWMGPLSVAWAVGLVAVAFLLANRTSSYGLFLTLFALAALGSGAFHPQGVMHAGRAPAGSSETTTAVFFLCGQLGLTFGPAIAGVLLAKVGPPGIYGMALAVAPVIVLMTWGLRHTSRPEVIERHHAPPSDTPRGQFQPGVVGLLVAIYTFRGWAIIGTASLLPVLFSDMGFGSTGYGVLTGLFWLGGAITGVLAGRMAQRFGRRPVVVSTTAAGSLLLLVLPVSGGWSTFALSLLTGAFLGAGHSILIVVAQSLLPVRQGLASGLALGYFFGIGAVASVLIGVLADAWTLAPVIQFGSLFGIVAAVLTLLLPASKKPGLLSEPIPAVEMHAQGETS